MSKRVYEIARELSLNTKEVIDRLNDAGVQVKNHFAAVEEPVFERVFGDGQTAEAAVSVATDGVTNGRRLPRERRAGESAAGSS